MEVLKLPTTWITIGGLIVLAATFFQYRQDAQDQKETNGLQKQIIVRFFDSGFLIKPTLFK